MTKGHYRHIKNNPIDNFMKHIQVTPGPLPTACWIWTGATKANGVGVWGVNHTTVVAHRWSYEYHKKAIPPGKYIEQHCHNHACCAPPHLEISSKQTTRRPRQKTSQYPGIYWHKRACRWQATYWHNGKNIYLGLFESEEDAFAKRTQYEQEQTHDI